MSVEDDVELLAQKLLMTQGTTLACQLMVKALLVRIVVNEADPDIALRKVFEQVSADLDRGQDALGQFQTTSIAHARRIVEETFSSFDQALSRKGARRKGKNDPG